MQVPEIAKYYSSFCTRVDLRVDSVIMSALLRANSIQRGSKSRKLCVPLPVTCMLSLDILQALCVCAYQLDEAPDIFLYRTTYVHARALKSLAFRWCRYSYWERWSWIAWSVQVDPSPVISWGPCSSKLLLRDCECRLGSTRGVVPDCNEPRQD